MPTYFPALSCANLRWKELPHIINKLNNFGLCDEELKFLSYHLLNNKSALVARPLQYKLESFFKEIILDGQMGKLKHYVGNIYGIFVNVWNFTKGVAHMFIGLH